MEYFSRVLFRSFHECFCEFRDTIAVSTSCVFIRIVGAGGFSGLLFRNTSVGASWEPGSDDILVRVLTRVLTGAFELGSPRLRREHGLQAWFRRRPPLKKEAK